MALLFYPSKWIKSPTATPESIGRFKDHFAVSKPGIDPRTRNGNNIHTVNSEITD